MAVSKGISYEDIIRDVRKGTISPVYCLMGDEPYYIDKVCEFLVETLLKPEEHDFNLDVLYGIETDVNRIIELSRAYPMMAERRVVLVREAQAMRSLDGLEEYVNHLTPTTVLILCYKHGSIDKRKAVYKAISNHGVVLETRKLTENLLPSFIQGYLKRKGGVVMEERAVMILSEHVGNDLCRLSAEMDKLVIALPEGKKLISVDMVEQLTGISKEYNNFELQKALARRDVTVVYKILKFYKGNSRAFVMPVILSGIFTFFSDVMLAFYAPEKNETGIADWLGKPVWKVRQEIIPAMRNYSGMKVLHILNRIRRTDAASKGVGGCKTTPEELLQELVFFILH